MSDPAGRCSAPSSASWLERELDGSRSAAWTILATASIFTRTWVEQPAEPLLTALLKLKLIDEDGEGPDEDQWDGYPAERGRAARAARVRSTTRSSSAATSTSASPARCATTTARSRSSSHAEPHVAEPRREAGRGASARTRSSPPRTRSSRPSTTSRGASSPATATSSSTSTPDRLRAEWWLRRRRAGAPGGRAPGRRVRCAPRRLSPGCRRDARAAAGSARWRLVAAAHDEQPDQPRDHHRDVGDSGHLLDHHQAARERLAPARRR